jgi:hypothetical protein
MRRWIVSIVELVAAITAGFAWAISSPPGSSPDEDFHLASIWCPQPVESSGCKVQTAPNGDTAIVVNARVFSAPVCYAFHPEILGACVFGVPTTPGLDERFNRGEYPGGYYRVMHLLVVSDPYTTTYLIRAVNVVLTALLGLLLVLANAGLAAVGVARCASARADAALFAALAALALLVLHLGAVRRHLVRLVLSAVAVVVAAVVYATSSQASTTLTGSGGQGETGSGWSAALFNILGLHRQRLRPRDEHPPLPAEVEPRSLPSDGAAITADSPSSTPVPDRVEDAPVADSSDDTPVRQV